MPAYFPGAFDDFVDTVVPELQRRGLYRNEYAGTTLRSHFTVSRSVATAHAAGGALSEAR
jgi:N-acetyl-S-(2-succino)cysteine monooxygenase